MNWVEIAFAAFVGITLYVSFFVWILNMKLKQDLNDD